MDDPNITMEEYIRLEEEKDRRHGRTFNWQTATFGKVKKYEDEDSHPNITMEEYIRLEEEKDRRHGRTFNWQTATFGKVKKYEDEDDYPIDFKTEFLAIVFDNTLTAIPSEPTICPPNENEVDFRILLDEFDDEDYTMI
ncbi:hypothetical protein Tco_0192316 [Tanacetum coccineum]